MSQDTDTVAVTAEDWIAAANEAREKRERAGRSGGPSYNSPESAPLVWFDQIFESEIKPAGTVECGQALRAGSTNNGLDLVLVASHANTANIAIAANATITVTLLNGDRADGEFVEVGPTICVKAPKEGITVEPDHLAARFALGNFKKPWLKVKIAFAGGITGGALDACLSHMPR